MIDHTMVSFHADSDKGCIRTNNEDTYICQPIWDEQHLLLAAIDGMGGYEGGEVAAQIARDTILQYLTERPNGERLQLLKEAVCEANNQIHKARVGNLSEMGCVASTALVEYDKGIVNLVHVGDTRLYQYQYATDQLIKISHDHSLIGYREEIGDLTEEEAMHHSMRSIIDRDLGSQFHNIEDRNFIEDQQFAFPPNSLLLLCSDGLCDMLLSNQIKDIVKLQDVSVPRRVEALIEAAKKAGGKDNVTVVLAEYRNQDIPISQPPVQTTPSQPPATPGQPLPTDPPAPDQAVPAPVQAPPAPRKRTKEEKEAKKKAKNQKIYRLFITTAVVMFLLGLSVGFLLGRCSSQNKKVEIPEQDTSFADTVHRDSDDTVNVALIDSSAKQNSL